MSGPPSLTPQSHLPVVAHTQNEEVSHTPASSDGNLVVSQNNSAFVSQPHTDPMSLPTEKKDGTMIKYMWDQLKTMQGNFTNASSIGEKTAHGFLFAGASFCFGLAFLTGAAGTLALGAAALVLSPVLVPATLGMMAKNDALNKPGFEKLLESFLVVGEGIGFTLAAGAIPGVMVEGLSEASHSLRSSQAKAISSGAAVTSSSAKASSPNKVSTGEITSVRTVSLKPVSEDQRKGQMQALSNGDKAGNGSIDVGSPSTVEGNTLQHLERAYQTQDIRAKSDVHFQDLKAGKFQETDDTLLNNVTAHTYAAVKPDKKGKIDIDKATETAMHDMYGVVRGGGDPCLAERVHGMAVDKSLGKADPKLEGKDWKSIDRHVGNLGAGCGAAMRAQPIGVKFNGEDNRECLIHCAVNNGFITHCRPAGYLGGVGSALFAAYAVEDVPFSQWMPGFSALLSTDGEASHINLAYRIGKNILETAVAETPKGIEKKEELQGNLEGDFKDFQANINYYQQLRVNEDGSPKLDRYPDDPEGKGQDRFMAQFSFKMNQGYPATGQERTDAPKEQEIQFNTNAWGWPGSSGHDSLIIAFDALYLTMNELRLAGDSPISMKDFKPSDAKAIFKKLSTEQQTKIYEKFMQRSAHHGGDSDSTGAIAGGLFGLVMGSSSIPKVYRDSETSAPLPQQYQTKAVLKAQSK